MTFHENTIDHFINKYEMNMFISLLWRDHIGGVMGDQVKHDYKIGICCFSAKSVEIRRKSKDLLARNQDNVSKWSNMSTCGLLFQ